VQENGRGRGKGGEGFRTAPQNSILATPLFQDFAPTLSTLTVVGEPFNPCARLPALSQKQLLKLW